MSTLTLDDLKHFWMPSGVPCFLADREDICDIVENMGFQIYYLISNNKIETKVTNSSPPANTYGYGYGNNTYTPNTYTTYKIEKKPQFFKVVNNFVGRAVTVAVDELPKEFVDIEEECTYSMPLIPLDIVRKLNEFFRLVYFQHGTESIVILTYDTSQKGSDGWGVLVPEQTNTAAHCKYDADSIASIKPDNVMIVGSVHSHPEMAAYASGTDHDDQVDFDGVHITYGWQKSVNNGETQYYAELQMSGKSYKLDIEDVLETVTIDKDPDPEVVEWSTKVKKAYRPYRGEVTQFKPGASPIPPAPTTEQYGPTTGKAVGVSKYSNRNLILSGTKYKEFTDALGIPENSVIVTEIDVMKNEQLHCYVCEYPINISDVKIGYCDICETPLVHPEDRVSTIVDKIEYYLISNDLPYNHPAYLYFVKDDGQPSVMRMTEEVLFYTKNSSVHKATEENSAFEDEYFPCGYMVCCGVKEEDREQECHCSPKVTTDDVLDFDRFLSDNAELYAPNSPCHDCVFYYSVKCPAYREILTEYVRSKDSFNIIFYANSLSGCSNYESYSATRSTDTVVGVEFQPD